ncbi:MAG TPA: integrase core domain-containing protein [Candidatus Woesebacteria bacterium]|nr:integrase core domain-containing protein [Candidatus Woesebacteria bacterium]
MKTLESSCAFDASDVARFRLKVIEFGQIHGWRAVRDAFGVSRSTYFLWKQGLAVSKGRLSSLIPHSTRPHHVRQMQFDPRLALFIRSTREQYGRIGKNKLAVLLAAYAAEIEVTPLKATTIGKIIKRNHYYFEGRRRYKKKKKSGILRVKKAPRETSLGYIEMDSVIVYISGSQHIFITAIDVVTKYAACIHAQSASSSIAVRLLMTLQQTYGDQLRAIQTDNGSEFLGVFDQYCQTHGIPHHFTYPRSPRINGGIERFNRTIQEEFIDRTDSLLLGSPEISAKLQSYLAWYNDTRPHQSLGYQSPSQYQNILQSNM